jgi:hypothetical protein
MSNEDIIYSNLTTKISCPNGDSDCAGIPNCGCMYEKSYSTQPWDPPTSCPSGFISVPDPGSCSECVSCFAFIRVNCSDPCPLTYNGVNSSLGDNHHWDYHQICCDNACVDPLNPIEGGTPHVLEWNCP